MASLVSGEHAKTSHALDEAIATQQEISDFIHEVGRTDHPGLEDYYHDAEDYYSQLDEPQKWVVDAVAKHLWQKRVNSWSNRMQHPEYSPDMNRQVVESLQKVRCISDHYLREYAEITIKNISLPDELPNGLRQL